MQLYKVRGCWYAIYKGVVNDLPRRNVGMAIHDVLKKLGIKVAW